MFEFNVIDNDLYVTIPKDFKFDFDFHLSIARLIWNIEFNRTLNPNLKIYVDCDADDIPDRMCAACLANVMDYYVRTFKLPVFVSTNFLRPLKEKVKRQTGNDYKTETDFIKLITNEELKYYVFHSDKETEKPVKDIVRLITEQSMTFTLNPKGFNDFLITTIGEIFSNSVNHSEQDEVFLMFSVDNNNGDYYLTVNIIDYGTTIVTNVRKFKKTIVLTGQECLNWAIQNGNTTRKGSGGYGLSTLINYIKAAKGTLYIFSGDSHYILNPDNKEIIDSKGKEFFCGTSVTFKVKLFDTDNILTYSSGSIGSVSLASLSNDFLINGEVKINGTKNL